MLKLNCRLITTRISKDSIQFTKESLEGLIKQINTSNKRMPFNVNHNFNRQIGFVIPKSAKLIKLDDGEFAVDAEAALYENQKEYKSYFVTYERPVELVSLPKILGQCSKHEDTNCPTYHTQKPIFDIIQVAPEFDEGLLKVKSPDCILQKGILIDKEYLVNYHNFLRRAHSRPNAFSWRLINKIREVMKKNSELRVYFQIIPNEISLKSEFRDSLEFDYSWGPKIPKKLDNLKVGVTQHASSKKDRELENLEKTDFWWKQTNDDLMELQIEELRNKSRHLVQPKTNKKAYPLKYAHLQYDKKSKKINHLDCALRIYLEDKFDERLQKNDISLVSKKDCDRLKLFKLQGQIDAKDAFDILSFFFENNSDVRQYFEQGGNESDS